MFSFEDDLFGVFLNEYARLLELFKASLQQLDNKREEAIKALFRVFHTLKSDSAFFELDEFTTVIRGSCEIMRGFDPQLLDDDIISFLHVADTYMTDFLQWLPHRSGNVPESDDLQSALTELVPNHKQLY